MSLFRSIKPFLDISVIKILSVLYVNNMIPVPEGVYSQVPYFNSVLMKEYEFCCSIRGGIIEMAKNVYYETGNSIRRYADFKVRENVYKQYTK